MAADRDIRALAAVLGEMPEVSARFDGEDLRLLLSPTDYTWGAGLLVDRALAESGSGSVQQRTGRRRHTTERTV